MFHHSCDLSIVWEGCENNDPGGSLHPLGRDQALLWITADDNCKEIQDQKMADLAGHQFSPERRPSEHPLASPTTDFKP